MAFELYFSVEEICQRIPRSPAFFRREIQRGAFGDLAAVLLVDGSYFVPLAGIEHYIRTHALPATVATMVSERLRPTVGARLFSDGVSARNGGELKRKLATDGLSHG